MNQDDRQELDRLWERHGRLEEELRDLSAELRAVTLRLRAQARTERPAEPVSQVVQEQPAFAETEQPPIPEPRPGPVPPPIPATVFTSGAFEPNPPITPSFADAGPAVALQEGGSGAPEPPIAYESGPRDRSIEMRLGTYWLVRVGIVMLLTGLVFFGNYTYQSFISKLGAPGKVGLMYFASAILLGAGAWWQRSKFRPNLRNYAEVLFAGGLAGVYFTTYAAHHITHLRVIQNPILDGFLLVAWAALIVFIADRRKSELLAMFAIGLAYYASIITRAGQFTLWSNLVLSVGALAFLLRNRWTGVSIASLVATYGGYVFWRFFEASAWRFPDAGQSLQLSAGFLCAYWAVFTAAVFLGRDERLAGANRAAFLTANNAAFFSLFVLTMYNLRTGGFWKISLGFGVVLLALAELSRRVLSSEPLCKNLYLTQGLLLVTIGFIAKFSGFTLALLLAAQSVVLLTLGGYRDSKVMRVAARISGLLAVFWCLGESDHARTGSGWLPAGVGAILFANALLSHWRRPPAGRQWFRLSPTWFTILAYIVWLQAAGELSTRQQQPIVLGVMGLALTLSIHLLRAREVSLLAQAYLLFAPMLWVGFTLLMPATKTVPPWWSPAGVLAVLLGAIHWWQMQKAIELSPKDRLTAQGIYALLFVVVLQTWIYLAVRPETFMSWTAVLALVVTVYAVGTRAWMLGASAQLMTLLSVLAFADRLAEPQHPHWKIALAPILALVLFATGVRDWFKRQPESGPAVREPLLKLAIAYRAAAVGMICAWVLTYIPRREVTWVFLALGAACFAWAGWRRDIPGLWFSAVFSAVGLLAFMFSPDWSSTVYLPNLVMILGIAVQERIAQRAPDCYPVPVAVRRLAAAAASLALWVFVSRYVLRTASGFYLTASWSAVALLLFGAGVILRERAYRWFGLAVLGFSLGRVVIFDVWKLQTLYRVLSFMALGTVLMVLGFIYNKYQERIRQWL